MVVPVVEDSFVTLGPFASQKSFYSADSPTKVEKAEAIFLRLGLHNDG